MNPNHATPYAAPAGLPHPDALTTRDFVTALGRIYLEAGLPLAAAFEAAFADCRSFGLAAEGGN